MTNLPLPDRILAILDDRADFEREEISEKLRDPMPAACAALIRELQAELKGAHAEIGLLTHKVITCGVAASHPDAELSTKRAYGSKWDSPQAQSVRKLRAEHDLLQAECARLRANIEAAARYGWEHPKWEWSAVKGGLDRFTDAALRGKETP